MDNKVIREKKQEKKQKQNDKNSQSRSKNKEKIVYAAAVVVILVISIASSKVNFLDTITGAVKGIWNKSQEVVENTSRVETVSKGSHVEISSLQVVCVREIYEILGEEIDKEQAVAILQEIKTLTYHGKEMGISAGKKEKEAFIEDLKKQLKKADEAQYERVVRRYGDEEDYWTILDSEIEDYLIAEKLKEDKRTKLDNKVDADVEKELQEYIDELVGYEKFEQISSDR